MTEARDVRIGIIGGGLMGRELAAVCGRWDLLVDHPVRPRIVAVADPAPAAREWFSRIDSVSRLTGNWRDLGLLDAEGAVLQTLHPGLQSMLRVDTERLSSGLYLLRLRGENGELRVARFVRR